MKYMLGPIGLIIDYKCSLGSKEYYIPLFIQKRKASLDGNKHNAETITGPIS